MQGKGYPKLTLKICAVAGFLFLCSVVAQGQEVRSAASSSPSTSEASEAPAEVRALAGLIRGLQDQVQTLNSQLGDLRMAQERASAEARGMEPKQLARVLRGDLDWITLKALERDRARRYGTPSELAADLLEPPARR